MAKKKPTPKKDISAAPEGAQLPEKEYKLPISSILMNQITEFSPRGFFLMIFDEKGNPQVVDYAEDAIMSRALENALTEVTQEYEMRRELFLESKIIGEDLD